VYFDVEGYKSYAQYFYGQKQPGALQSKGLKEYLRQQTGGREVSGNEFAMHERGFYEYGVIDKPVYICCRVTNTGAVSKIFGFKEVDEKEGMCFLRGGHNFPIACWLLSK